LSNKSTLGMRKSRRARRSGSFAKIALEATTWRERSEKRSRCKFPCQCL